MIHSLRNVIRTGSDDTVKAVITVFLAVLLLIIGSRTQAGTIAPDLQETLTSAGPNEEIPVIVSLADSFDPQGMKGETGLRRAAIIRALQSKAEATQAPLLAVLMRQDVRNIKKFWIFNGLAFPATPETIRALAEHPAIGSIRLDATLKAPVPEAATATLPEWNISTVHAPELWNLGITGQGVVVAGMDTGVDPYHQDIAGKWRGGTNSWFDPHGQYASPHDTNGHGTQTMGLMVGGDRGGTAIGMAPDAQWIAVKIYDNQDLTTLSAIHLGFQWLLDPDGDPSTDDAPDVVNNSWGFEVNAGDCITEFQPDIDLLRQMDIGVVFSAGNGGPYPDSSVSPANNPGALAVGAVDDTLAVTYFSSRGPSACGGDTFPELVAPGAAVRTADLTYGGSYPDSYVSVSGTSFAAPHVAGAMALLRSADPFLSIAEMESALTLSALDLGPVEPDNNYGSGLLDIAAAYEMLIGGSSPVCTDNDLDGYFAEGGECGPVDCNDADAAVNPAACDIKDDGIDQDCDGFDRVKGKPCSGSSDNGTTDTVAAEGKGNTCSDGIDNDGDFLFDCADPDCSTNRKCR